MGPRRSVESWAQKIVQDELQESVVVHDDNSQPSMYDLRIGPADSPTTSIECVGAVDRVGTETWNLMARQGPLTLADAARQDDRRGQDGAALPALTRAVEALERRSGVTVTGPIYVDARDKSARELFDLIEQEAERRGSAGSPTFIVRPGG